MVPLIPLLSQAHAQSWTVVGHAARDHRPINRDRSNGFYKSQGTTAEDGSKSSSTLWISPRRVAGGWIGVDFPLTRVPPHAVFRAKIGFIRSAGKPSDGVDYEVAIRYSAGKKSHETVIRYGHKNYTGSLVSIDLDLSPFAAVADNGEVSVILRVGAGNQSDNDTLLWIDPRFDTGKCDPYQFELCLDHFRVQKANESSDDEPTVLVRAAWIDGDRFDVKALASANAALLTPDRISLTANGTKFDKLLQHISWRPVQIHPELLGADEAASLNRFALTVLFTERDDSDTPERNRGEQLADDLLRLRMSNELLRLVLDKTRNLSQRAPRHAFASVAQMFRVWLYEETRRGYGETVRTGGDNDDLVGSASFETSLLDLLLAGRSGLMIQLNHQDGGEGRYEMAGRITLHCP
jgi:hypothetical protein